MQRWLILFLFILPNILLSQADYSCSCDSICVNTIAKKMWTDVHGKTQEPCPIVVIDTDSHYASYLNIGGNDPRIRVDKKWLDSLHQQFGCTIEAVMAAIIGHELEHAIAKTQGKIYGSLIDEEEMEADWKGLLSAYAIGHKESINVFEKIIESFDYPATPNYPSIAERKKTGAAILTKAKQAITTYEVVNFLMLMGGRNELQTADDLLTHIGEELINFKEIYYSRGLVSFLYALRTAQSPTFYPIELSAPNFLPNRNGTGYLDKYIIKRLEQANNYFLKTLELDTSFIDAHLGLICIDIELGNFKRAQRQINEIALPSLSDMNCQKIDLLRGIITLKQNGDDKKLKAIGQSDIVDSYIRKLAEFNLTPSAEKITNFQLSEVDAINKNCLSNKNIAKNIIFAEYIKNTNVKLSISTHANSSIILMAKKYNSIIFQESKLFLSDINHQLLADLPARQWAGNTYFYLVSPTAEAIIEVDSANKIKRCIKVIRDVNYIPNGGKK